MRNKRSINISGSINGIVNFGNNSININEENNTLQLDDNNIEKSDISNNNDFTTLEKEKFSSKIIKTIVEIIIGIIISVIAGYILYKLNMN